MTIPSRGKLEAMLASLTGLGLSAAAGLNAYIPLLLVGVLARFTDVITLPEPYRWIQSGWAIAIVSVLLAAELILDKVAVVDHVNDVVQTLVRPTVGTGTPFVSAAEDAASLGMSLVAVFLPILVVVVLLLFGWAAYAMLRRVRRRRRSAAF